MVPEADTPMFDRYNVGARIDSFLRWLTEHGYAIAAISEGTPMVVEDVTEAVIRPYLKEEWKGRLAEVAERFWSQVDRSGECWLWTGGRDSGGYGKFAANRFSKALAHRFAYELLVGPIPEGLHLDHVKKRGCIGPQCVNPAHLEPVTPLENMLRGESVHSRNARKTHCIYGHAFTPDNTYHPPSRPNTRECRACKAARSAARLPQRKAKRAVQRAAKGDN